MGSWIAGLWDLAEQVRGRFVEGDAGWMRV